MNAKQPTLYTSTTTFPITEKDKSLGRKILAENMGLQPFESFLVVTDPSMFKEGCLWFEAGKSITPQAKMIVFSTMTQNAQEPPEMVAKAMKNTAVVMLQTRYSLSHTNARAIACQNGSRLASLPNASLEILHRTLSSDYQQIKKLSLKLARRLTQATSAVVTSRSGTNLSFSLKGRLGDPDTGFYTHPGDFGNLPAGESYIAPVEGSAQGSFCVDGSFAGLYLDSPITITVKNGLAVSIAGGQAAKELERQLQAVGAAGYNLAELGIGVNQAAKPTGRLIEAEKAYGTVHIALGDNHTFGGIVTAPFHSDGVILQPTLYLDNVAIIKDGEFYL